MVVDFSVLDDYPCGRPFGLACAIPAGALRQLRIEKLTVFRDGQQTGRRGSADSERGLDTAVSIRVTDFLAKLDIVHCTILRASGLDQSIGEHIGWDAVSGNPCVGEPLVVDAGYAGRMETETSDSRLCNAGSSIREGMGGIP